MPPPSSTEELVLRLRRSGLVPLPELDSYVTTLPRGLAPRQVLDRMVADQVLTAFQADRLAAGKYKGFLLGGYVILDKLGTGGMGQVFLAEHGTLRRLVAIKVMPAAVIEDPVARERFYREARAAAALDHPNIVRVFDLNKEGGLPYLVMEHVDGLSLQTLVSAGGPLAPAAAAGYALQVACGLQHAHERGLVHRDIKPGNVLVDRHGVARILDLGLVRNTTEADAKLTSQLGGQSILGTADYLAPEQAVDSSRVDTRADIYSLGATLYYTLAGRPMFPDGRTAQKLMWQQWKEPTPIRELRPEVPEGLAAAVHAALMKKPEQRFQTPRAFAEAVAPFAAGRVPPDPTLITAPPVRRWVGRASEMSGRASGVGGSSRSAVAAKSGYNPPSSDGLGPGPIPVARLPDQTWGQRFASADDTPRSVLSTPPPRPSPLPSSEITRPTPPPPARLPPLPPPGPLPAEPPTGSDDALSPIPDDPPEPRCPPVKVRPRSRWPLVVGLVAAAVVIAGTALYLLAP